MKLVYIAKPSLTCSHPLAPLQSSNNPIGSLPQTFSEPPNPPPHRALRSNLLSASTAVHLVTLADGTAGLFTTQLVQTPAGVPGYPTGIPTYNSPARIKIFNFPPSELEFELEGTNTLCKRDVLRKHQSDSSDTSDPPPGRPTTTTGNCAHPSFQTVR